MIDFFIESIKDDFIELITTHKLQQHDISIVSASPDIWINSFADKMGINAICTEVHFNNENRFTGNFKTKNCVAIEKAIRIKQVHNLTLYSEIISYGNSADDAEMFKLATTYYKI